MIDIGGFELSALEYGILLDNKKAVTSKSFRVIIPRLCPRLSQDKVNIQSVSPNKSRILNKDFKVSGYKTQNFLEAENITSLRTKHKGNVYDMSKSQGITEKETMNKMPVKLIHKPKGGPPHPPHEHMIKKPFKFYDMVYETLNDESISKGAKLICGFMGGNIYDVKVVYIPDIIPRS